MLRLALAMLPAVAFADGGAQLGARSGVELDRSALFLGLDLRLSFDLSPLTVSLTADQFFVGDDTLFQVGANTLYDLPLARSGLRPYVGIGVAVTRFEIPEMPGARDSNGMRIGMNFVGGVRFEHAALPVLRPFAQVMASLGPIDLFTIGGGVLFQLGGG